MDSRCIAKKKDGYISTPEKHPLPLGPSCIAKEKGECVVRAGVPPGPSCTAKGNGRGWDQHPFPPGSHLPHCNATGEKRGTSNASGPRGRRAACAGSGEGTSSSSGPQGTAGGRSREHPGVPPPPLRRRGWKRLRRASPSAGSLR